MHERTSPVATAAQERFVDVPMAVAFALYGLFALTFSYFQVKGDGLVYFNLLRRFFGEEPDFAYAYQFGSAVWNAPFFLVGKTFGIAFGFQPTIFHVSFEEISITLAANAAFVVTLYLGWRLLGELDLPRGPGVLFATAFGTPLLFHIVFDPSGKHAVDTLVLTAAAYAYLRCESSPVARSAVVLGALAGWSFNVRWANVAFFAALALAMLARDRMRPLVAPAAAAAVVAGGLIFAMPALRGIEYFYPLIEQPAAAPLRVAAPAGGPVAAAATDTSDPADRFDPTIPAKMLFSEHRGLFLWTPLTALAAVGFGLAFVRARQSGRHAGFYSGLLAAALGLLCIHVVWSDWDGGFAFSARFLTGLFPLYLIGIAELVRRAGAWIYPVLAVACVFSVWVALVRDVGYDGLSARDGLGRVVEAGYENRSHMRVEVQDDAKARWVYLWSLLHGRDPKCVNLPASEC